jgi:hypothetical protein
VGPQAPDDPIGALAEASAHKPPCVQFPSFAAKLARTSSIFLESLESDTGAVNPLKRFATAFRKIRLSSFERRCWH